MAYNKGWKIIHDSYAFSNAIRLIVFLITGKLVKFDQHVFCFLKIWFRIGQYEPFHTIIDNIYFVFIEFVVSGSCLHEFEMCYGCVFQKRIYCIILKNGEMTQRYLKSNLSVLFLGWYNIPNPNIRDCPLNNSLNLRYSWMPYCSVVSRRFL